MRIVSTVIFFLIFQGLVAASSIVHFEEGCTEVVATLAGLNNTTVVRFDVPLEGHILSATMKVSAMAPDGYVSGRPNVVQMLLDDTLLWEFNGKDYGALGMQDGFVNNMSTWKSVFTGIGGSNNTNIRLPKNAIIQNATAKVICEGPGGLKYIVNFTGNARNDYFGHSVSGAGDVNKDGYDDVIVGAYGNDTGANYTGGAYIFFGGASIDRTADVAINGDEGDWLGYSVSGAGDVNGDGYDDVIANTDYHIGDAFIGRAQIYFGGQNMDNAPDVILTGTADGDYFGWPISGAGDVNNDGYDDVIVGAPSNDSGGYDVGSAYVYFGGANMDSDADVTLTGENASDEFGSHVSDAGDVNNDGYDDVIVSSPYNDACGLFTGKAYIFYGGTNMNSVADVVLTGEAAWDYFGESISSAGDVNDDGYDDVVVGATYNNAGGEYAGRVYVYFGGPNMDSKADVIITGEAAGDFLGYPVSSAGDINNDGYDDIIACAQWNDTTTPGATRVYYFLGGADMDNRSDGNITGPANDDSFGCSISGAGDVNNDSSDDIVIGAAWNDEAGWNFGKATVYCGYGGVVGPKVFVGDSAIMDFSGYCNWNRSLSDFSGALTKYICATAPSGVDGYGNAYIDVPIKVTASSNGTITLCQLKITYNYTAAVPDFSDELGTYIHAHKSNKDANGNISVPITVCASSSGRLKLHDLSIAIDEAPTLVNAIPNRDMPEDSAVDRLIDLYNYFEDDYDSVNQLKFGIVSASNASIVKTTIQASRYISIDAANGGLNDNWTGTVQIIVNCSDRWGSVTESNAFQVTIRNVPDPPVIVSIPPVTGIGGNPYFYKTIAVDGDNDKLTYWLEEYPQNMTIDSSSGEINWISAAGGEYHVSVGVTDGVFARFQDYIITVLNRLPKIIDMPIPDAYVGVIYTYNLTAIDEDGDKLMFSLVSRPDTEMTVNPLNGMLSWTPSRVGTFRVSLAIIDRWDTITYTFNITVKQGNRAPNIKTSPVTSGFVGVPYTYNASALDIDGDALAYALVEMPLGMTIDGSSGKVSWTPTSAGDFMVRMKVMDGKGGEAIQEFFVNVTEKAKPRVKFITPAEGETVEGEIVVAGGSTRGTLDIVNVQMRVDSGGWTETNGISSWQLNLDTSKLKNGKHVLQARAYDGMEYSNPINRTIMVDNPTTGGHGFIPGFGGVMTAVAVAMVMGYVLSKKRG